MEHKEMKLFDVSGRDQRCFDEPSGTENNMFELVDINVPYDFAISKAMEVSDNRILLHYWIYMNSDEDPPFSLELLAMLAHGNIIRKTKGLLCFNGNTFNTMMECLRDGVFHRLLSTPPDARSLLVMSAPGRAEEHAATIAVGRDCVVVASDCEHRKAIGRALDKTNDGCLILEWTAAPDFGTPYSVDLYAYEVYRDSESPERKLAEKIVMLERLRAEEILDEDNEELDMARALLCTCAQPNVLLITVEDIFALFENPASDLSFIETIVLCEPYVASMVDDVAKMRNLAPDAMVMVVMDAEWNVDQQTLELLKEQGNFNSIHEINDDGIIRRD